MTCMMQRSIYILKIEAISYAIEISGNEIHNTIICKMAQYSRSPN